MRQLSTKSVLPFLALVFLISASLACGGISAPTQGAQATNSPEPVATLEQVQPTIPPTSTPPATLSERGTPDEAKAMLQKAVEHYNSVGREQALTDFTAGVAPFIDRDLYVFCLSRDGIITANGGFPSYVGTSADILKDANGNPLGQQLVDAASGQEVGSVQYLHINPVSGDIEPKIAYVKNLGEDVCGVGAYNPQ